MLGTPPRDADALGDSSPRVRVAHIVETVRSGGAETVVRELCGALGRHGVDATIVSIYDPNLDAEQRAALGVPLVEIGRKGRYDVGFFSRLVAALEALEPDVAHVHLHAGKYAGRLAAIAAGVPSIVLTEHGDDRDDPLRAAVRSFLNPRTTRFIALTYTQRRALAISERVPLERIEVIPNGVGVTQAPSRARTRLALAIPAQARALYLPARLCPQKNQALAVRALALAAANGRADWMLVLAGKGPDEPSLRRLVRALGIRDRVRFLGYRPDAPALHAAMDAFLMPSLWERMPLALGEAMLANVPVVTAPWEGHGEFVLDGATGFVSADWSATALCSAIARALDPDQRAPVVAAARQRAERRFDFATTVRSHASLYRRLAAGA